MASATAVFNLLKSRGMSHSNQIREYLLTNEGVLLVDAYLGASGVLTGSARLAMEAQMRIGTQQQREEVARRRRELDSRRAVTERKIAELHAEIAAQDAEAGQLTAQDERRETAVDEERAAMGASRGIHANGKDESRGISQRPHAAMANA